MHMCVKNDVYVVVLCSCVRASVHVYATIWNIYLCNKKRGPTSDPFEWNWKTPGNSCIGAAILLIAVPAAAAALAVMEVFKVKMKK